MINIVGGLSLGRVALFAGVLTLTYYATLYDNGESIIQATDAAQVQLESEKLKQVETQKTLKKEQQMKADVELMAKKFEEIKAQIPLDFLESDLRAIVDQHASRNGLKTTRTDRRPSPMKVTASNNGNENLVEQVALGYEFEGTYNNIAKFVMELSSLEKLIKIGDFELSVRTDYNVKSKTKDLVFKVNIIGFKQSIESLNTGIKKDTL